MELTDERKTHIAERHPDLLAEPDQVCRSVRFVIARLFSGLYDDVKDGK